MTAFLLILALIAIALDLLISFLTWRELCKVRPNVHRLANEMQKWVGVQEGRLGLRPPGEPPA